MGSQSDIQRRRIWRMLGHVVLPCLYPATAPLEVEAHFVAGEPIEVGEAEAREFRPFSLGQPWGGAWSTAWFRLSGSVPEEWAGEHVVARLGLGYHGGVGFGGEGLLFDGERPLQGINPGHGEAVVASPAAGGEPVELYLEAAANPHIPWGGLEWPMLLPDYEGAPLYRLERAELAVADREVESAWDDLRILAELADALGETEPRSIAIMRTLDQVALAVDAADVRHSLLSQRPLWRPLLETPGAPRRHLVTAVGHAHIDTAWLWPLRETRRKCARTFSSALSLMDDEPDFVFVCSQAQQHEWMRQHYPSLFARMREKAAGGQFEPVGSMWVEADTNLPSGESLVRQLVYGKRFFLEHYGRETEDCWLPDAFGYSASLPQILLSAGVRFFLTQKLSWNEIDRFPHHTFWWEGIDGSRVLAHCPPTDTYNGEFRIAQLLKGERDFAEHGLSERSLYPFGYGDGGGGPTRSMLESFRRLKDLQPLPKVELGTATGFFRAVEAEAMAADDLAKDSRPGSVETAHAPGPGGLPIWMGELYLERHRAVQTTQAHVKLGNRRCEDLLREAELWAVAGLEGDFPRRELERAWRLVLLHQFHDMLPGSSIHWVHEDSEADYATVRLIAEEVIERACTAIASRIGDSGERAIVVFNAGSHARRDLVEIDGSLLAQLGVDGAGRIVAVADADDRPAPLQELTGGTFGFVASVPGCGWARYRFRPASAGDEAVGSGEAGSGEAGSGVAATVEADEGGFVLSNGLLRVRLESDGTVSSLRHHTTGRELIAAGSRGNVFQLHQDLPNDTDAWDVDLGTFARAVELGEAESVEVVERGPVRVAVRLVHAFGNSRLTQEVRLAAGSRRLEFATAVEWAERHRFLKVAFPLAVRAAAASFEVQFGHLQRPTHANTSWDIARFEVPAQRWADLSEPGSGVALLNDCKYGYDVRGSVIRLSLLRGPTWPDPAADRRSHRFAYAVMPHGGLAASLREAGSVVEEAEAFNLHLRPLAVPASPALGGSDLPPSASVLEVEGAMVSSVKRADAGEDLVVRFYEAAGAHGRVSVKTGAGGLPAITSAERTDVLERPLSPEPVGPGSVVEMDVRPFELVTLKLHATAAQPLLAQPMGRSSDTEPASSTAKDV